MHRDFRINDSYWSDEFKIYCIMSGIGREIEILEDQKKNLLYADNGFSIDDFNELIELYKHKQNHLINNIHNDESWDWNASMHYIVTGTKKV